MGGALLLRQPSEQNAELHTTSVHYVGSDGRKMVGIVFHPPEAAVPPVYALRTFERVPECEGASAGDFRDACEDVLRGDEFHPRRFFVERLLAIMDYQLFFSMMVGEARLLKN